MRYCIDTSCLIAAWEERYPIDHFPKFWALLEAAMTARKICALIAVHDETEKKSKELHDWLGNREGLFVDLNEDIETGLRSSWRSTQGQ